MIRRLSRRNYRSKRIKSGGARSLRKHGRSKSLRKHSRSKSLRKRGRSKSLRKLRRRKTRKMRGGSKEHYADIDGAYEEMDGAYDEKDRAYDQIDQNEELYETLCKAYVKGVKLSISASKKLRKLDDWSTYITETLSQKWKPSDGKWSDSKEKNVGDELRAEESNKLREEAPKDWRKYIEETLSEEGHIRLQKCPCIVRSREEHADPGTGTLEYILDKTRRNVWPTPDKELSKDYICENGVFKEANLGIPSSVGLKQNLKGLSLTNIHAEKAYKKWSNNLDKFDSKYGADANAYELAAETTPAVEVEVESGKSNDRPQPASYDDMIAVDNDEEANIESNKTPGSNLTAPDGFEVDDVADVDHPQKNERVAREEGAEIQRTGNKVKGIKEVLRKQGMWLGQ